MMKPPFKVSDGVTHAQWFTVWFVASLSCINMTEVMKYIVMSCPLVQYQAIITSPSGSHRLADYKPDIVH